jgi:cell fate (sporulation/competence/biofilm development) regulator YlbF (YheA/YmcA/DUF963 family)
MDILDKASELGRMIAESAEMVRLKDSEVALESDECARGLMEDYKKLQIELVKASREKKSVEAIELIKERLIGKQLELNEYGKTNEYLEAKSAFDRFMSNINNVITFAITGEDCSPSKCGTCKGCS